MLDANGALLGEGISRTYGANLVPIWSIDTPHRYHGQFGCLSHTPGGLIHMGLRAYLPQIGRFLQRDPIGYQASPNVYAFCGGDPVNLADPLGLFDWSWYWRDVKAFAYGELCAVNPINWVRGICNAGSFMNQRGWMSGSAWADLGGSVWESLQFWNKTDMVEAGQSFMGDLLILSPAGKRIPAPTALQNLARGVQRAATTAPRRFAAALRRAGYAGRAAAGTSASSGRFLEFFHKGNLIGSRVTPRLKAFSMTASEAEAASLPMPGPIHRFRIPEKVFAEWVSQRWVRQATTSMGGAPVGEWQFTTAAQSLLDRFRVP